MVRTRAQRRARALAGGTMRPVVLREVIVKSTRKAARRVRRRMRNAPRGVVPRQFPMGGLPVQVGDWLFSDKPFSLPTGGVDNIARIQHKQVVSLTADSMGNLRMAVVPSPLGGVGYGSVSPGATSGPLVDGLLAHLPITSTSLLGAITEVNQATNTAPVIWSAPIFTLGTAGGGANNGAGGNGNPLGGYPIVPYTEWASNAPWSPIQSGGQGVNYQPSRFRVSRQAWRLLYTGAPLYASGQIAFCQQHVGTEKIVPGEGNAGVVQNYSTTGNSYASTVTVQGMDVEVLSAGYVPATFQDMATAPKSRVFNIKPGAVFGGINLPRDMEWKVWREQTVPSVIKAGAGTSGANGGDWPAPPNGTATQAIPLFAQLCVTTGGGGAGGNTFFAGPAPGLGELPVTFFAASGLSTSPLATWTLEVVTDVEYEVMATSPIRRFTIPPMPDSVPLKHVIAEVAAKVEPAVETTSAGGGLFDSIGRAVGWYADTWGKIAGTVWGGGGKLLQDVGLFPQFGKAMQGLGNLVSGGGNLAITN